MRAHALPAALLLLTAVACSTNTVRLYELREAEAGSRDQQAYVRLAAATELANAFLAESELTAGFPASEARFELGLTDLIVRLRNVGSFPVRIETAGWGDPRTLFGDGLHSQETGFAAGQDRGARPGDHSDNIFFLLSSEDMAATLLRQTVVMREVQARGELGYWLNYDLLGLDPTVLWWRGAKVDEAAYAVEDAFYLWLRNRP